MKSKLLQNLSANTLQLVVNQLSGLAIFYLLSTGLSKNNFGQLNLVLAILLFAFNLLALGIEQVSIRKTAGGDDLRSLLSIYIGHVLITGLLFYGALLVGSSFISANNGLFPILLMVGAGKLMIYFSTPFKQLTSGLEKFKTLGLMLVISNSIRSCALLVLAFMHQLNLHTVIIVFVAGDTVELLLTIYLFKRTTAIPVTFKWNKLNYLALLRESLPQTGVTILTSAISRFDWIFIGFMVSAVKLAEYSFAYKVFEISTFPLLAIAPLLIPRFTKLFKQNSMYADELRFLIRAELAIAAFTVLVLNVTWAPVVDTITGGKYGLINVKTIFFLSLCIPFLYLNNFFWTIYFAQGRMQMILKGFVITFIVNAGLDLLLIPFFKNEGAAVAFLISCATQTIFYASQNRIPELKNVGFNLVICTGCALASIFIAGMCFTNYLLVLLFATILFLILLVLTAQVKVSDGKTMSKVLLHKNHSV